MKLNAIMEISLRRNYHNGMEVSVSGLSGNNL